MAGKPRIPIGRLLDELLDISADPRPLLILDLWNASAGDDGMNRAEIKARILRSVFAELNRRAEALYNTSGDSLNTLVVLDEARKYASSEPGGKVAGKLAADLEDYVSTTRKYGLGFAFISQEIGSLRPGIFRQLRINCFGYGLTSGSERRALTEVSDDQSIFGLYSTFVDPKATEPAQYSFMVTGPASPLSFSGQPVFINVFTSLDAFKLANGYEPPEIVPW